MAGVPYVSDTEFYDERVRNKGQYRMKATRVPGKMSGPARP